MCTRLRCLRASPAKVVHGNYVPLTPRKQRGHFDIVVRRDSAELDDGLGSTRSDREFSRYLDNLPVGERGRHTEGTHTRTQQNTKMGAQGRLPRAWGDINF